MQRVFGCLIGWSSLLAQFNTIESATDLQQKILSKKECIIAIGMSSCIPCDAIKASLIHRQKRLPEIYWVDLHEHPRMRQVFNFKAIPYLVIYKQGLAPVCLTGEKNCQDYLASIRY
jgi:hypothetical protein